MLKHLAFLAAFASAPLAAQTGTVSASDPAGLVALFEAAGYSPELSTDSYDDPLITLELDGAFIDVIFYGCSEEDHTGCDAIQFSAGFDAPDGITPQTALEISSKFRFASVSLDDENDPFIRWDVVTGDGIPAGVMLQSLRLFEDTLVDASAMIFPEEEATAAATGIAVRLP